jgi:hypothetical protein
VTVARRLNTRERLVADLGLYVQDTWTVKRMTVNAGLRFDYLNNKVEAQETPGGRWIGPRSFAELTDVPSWQDLGPRLGVAYDLFGNGKTALKATMSRYVETTTVGFARLLSDQRHGQQRQPELTDSNRQDSAGLRARSARQHLRHAHRLHDLRSGRGHGLGQAAEQLGVLRERNARADVACRGGFLVLPQDAGELSGHGQPRCRKTIRS